MSSRIGSWLAQHPDPLVWSVVERGAGAAHWLRRGHVVRHRIVSQYLRSTSEPKLQIGAWRFPLSGWLNSDLVTGSVHLDLTRPLALPDSTFSYVFGEHVIEHLSERHGVALLRELRRILRPGGVVRLTTPDLKKIIALYEDRHEGISLRDYLAYFNQETWHHARPCQLFNTYLRHWGHKYIYDEEDLAAKLREAGFDSVERCDPGQSRHPALAGIERHHEQTVDWVNDVEAMTLEAARSFG